MSRVKPFIILILCILAVFLRLYRLGNVPPSPSLDEVSIGYNAFSIGKTGMDEYKNFFPLQLRAYDDFRPALYIYPVVATVFMFGLSAFSVRFPSAIFSLITLFFIYQTASLLGKKYFKSDTLSIWALALSAVSPWHIYISRLGHEVNLGLTLFTAGAYALMHWVITQKKSGLYWAAVLMALSLYGYQSEKVVLPIFGAIVVTLFWRRLFASTLIAIKAFVLFVLFASFAVVLTLSPEGLSRLHGTSAIGKDSPNMQNAEVVHAKAVISGDKVGALLSSKYVTAATIIVNNYVSHFSPRWLFTGERRESHKVPDMGLFAWWTGLVIALGLLYAYRVTPRNVFLLLAAWIFTGPIPAAITTQAPHAMRAITMFPPMIIFAAIGIGMLERYIRIKSVVGFMCALLLLYQGIHFSHQYFTVFPKEQSDSFQYALGNAIEYLRDESKKYSRVIVTNEGAGYQSYMFFLFYSQYDPSRYLKNGGTTSGGYAQMHKIDNVSFEPIENTEQVLPNTLYIADVSLLPHGGSVKRIFANKDGKPAVVAISL